ncbi:MAG: hypothetical protein HYT14_02665 [Candidatus Liptonbacteria bacterium]|nr:hypothetical protein [Candidatus Liptonbacteria bacterium]
MPGPTTTAALDASLPTMRFGARLIEEQKQGNIRETVDRITLPKNQGNVWSEVNFAKLTAQAISETTDLIDSPEQLVDALDSITPTDNGIHILYTDRVADRVITQAASIVRSGALGMNAILRKENIDGIVQGRGSTTDLGAAGAPLTSTLVRHAKYRISSNVTEPNNGPYHMQHHGFVLADIDDELTAAVGTYEITQGVTAEVFGESYAKAPRMIGGVIVHENGDMTIDASDDCEGFVYAKMGLILVEGRGTRTETQRRPNIGGGSTSVYMYKEYAWGFRSSGNWSFSLTADALAPA